MAANRKEQDRAEGGEEITVVSDAAKRQQGERSVEQKADYAYEKNTGNVHLSNTMRGKRDRTLHQTEKAVKIK
jgi:hypothetical protein